MGILIGSGISTSEDSAAAGREASLQAVAALGAVRPALLLIFATDHYADQELLAAVQAAGAPATVAGCSSAGILGATGVYERAVAVMALGGDGFESRVAVGEGIAHGQSQASTQIGEALLGGEAELDGPAVAITLASRAKSLDELTHQLSTELGPLCPLVGAGAGDNLTFSRQRLFYDQQTLSESALVVALTSPYGFGIGVQHGCTPAGRNHIVTSSDGGIVHEIDHRPATAFYRDLLAESGRPFEEFAAVSLLYPIGLVRSGGSVVRSPLGLEGEGSVRFGGDVPARAIISAMRLDSDSLIAAAGRAAEQARSALGGRRAAGVIVFSCVTRRLLLGPECRREVEALTTVFGPEVPIVGMYSYGEIGGGDAPVVCHNTSIVVLAIAAS